MKKTELLIVEDSVMIANQLRDLVVSLGYCCLGVVDTAEEAIQKTIELEPDVILMDIWLKSEMNGLEAASEIHKLKETPVIFLTASADLSLIENIKLSQGSSYMMKPIDPIELQFNIELSIAKAEHNLELKNQKRWQEAILESVVDGVIAEDEFGQINYINLPGRKLLDITSDYIGKKANDFFKAYWRDTEDLISDDPTKGNIECHIVTHTEKKYSVIMKIANITSEEGIHLGRAITLTNITGEVELQSRVNYLTFHDSMTGLYNRNYLDEEIERLNTSRQLPISLIMADLNGLKISNDLMGHDEGDNIIRMSADVLRNACRTEDLLARIGGDEFLLFLPETDEEAAEEICQRILASAQRRTTKLGPLSIAVGHYTKTVATENIRLCITKADENMYARKNQMKRRFYEDIFSYLYRKMHSHYYEGDKVTGRVREIMTKMCLLDPVTTGMVKEAVLLSDVYDIGMICLDEETYTTKFLDDDDRKTIRRHCETGARIADMNPQHQKISKYILYHHHRYDGLGSSDGIKGDQIPLLSRMLTVVDTFVAITGERVYRAPMTFKQATTEIAKGAGNQFDPWAVNLFFKAIERIEIVDINK